jgi:broad specificity phosphatase PhoE
VRELVLARHAESELNVLERLNGDPSVADRLTEAGRGHARALGQAAGPVDLVVHTEFSRTRETAELAWPGVPRLVVPELNEFSFGSYEGTPWTEGFEDWVRTSTSDVGAPGGGESRVAAVQRFVRGYRTVLERTEDRVAVVAHGAPVRYVLLALDGKSPVQVLEGVDRARPFIVDAERLADALDALEAWAAAPSW